MQVLPALIQLLKIISVQLRRIGYVCTPRHIYETVEGVSFDIRLVIAQL